MERIDHAQFEARRSDFDAAVSRTPDIGRFCSGSAWNLAARACLDPAPPGTSEEFIWTDAATDSWLLFRRSERGYWQPYEASWMFASPLIGPDPAATVRLFGEAVRGAAREGPQAFALGGLPESSTLRDLLLREADRRAWRHQEFPGTDSLILDLTEGTEPWLRRRSRKFRRSLEAACRRCAAEGLRIEAHHGPGDGRLFARMLRIQRRTTKWETGSDILQDSAYRSFYERLFDDLSLRGALRLLIATRGAEDLGYIFGGVLDGEYRGLQMAYDAAAASLGVGNWLQWENLLRRADEGIALYDLGMDADYKRRWADRCRVQRVAFFVL